jgi:SAM-dependent methyltransferase
LLSLTISPFWPYAQRYLGVTKKRVFQQPAKVAADYGKRKYHLNIFQGFLADAGFPGEYFDVITMLDALCCLPDPRSELETIHRILKPEGKLFLELPNLDYRLIKDWGPVSYLTSGRWVNLYQGAHIAFYNQKSIRALLHESGFQIEGIHASTATMLGRVWHDRIVSWYQWVALWLFKMSLEQINLCSKFIVVARKR